MRLVRIEVPSLRRLMTSDWTGSHFVSAAESPGLVCSRAREVRATAYQSQKSGKSQGDYRTSLVQTGHNAHHRAIVYKFEKIVPRSKLAAYR